jgi:hypothetical protein
MRLAPCRLVVCAVVALGVAGGIATPASAAVGTPPAGLRPLTIKTIPALPGVRLALDDFHLITGPDGTASTLITKDERSALAADVSAHLRVLTPQLSFGSVRAQFHGWYSGGYHFTPGDTRGLTEIATFDFDYLTTFSFTNADGGRVASNLVTSAKIKSSEGATIDIAHPSSVWLRGRHVSVTGGDITLSDVEYRFTSVMYHGANVVLGSRPSFVPARDSRANVALRLYRVEFDTNGMFGERAGTSLRIELPDGTTQTHTIRHGVAVVPDLPPGELKVNVRLLGIGGAQTATISRNQKVALRVLSFPDIAALGSAGLVVLAAVLLAGRRARRRRRVAADLRESHETVEPESQVREAALTSSERS